MRMELLAGWLLWLGVLSGVGCANHSPAPSDPMAAFTPDARILFQGDSITDGNRGRSPDPNHILGHGYQALIASRFGADLPERRLTFFNRGISGNTVADLAKRWTNDTVVLEPDLLSILIGINDLHRGLSAEQYREQYDQLLAFTVAALPGVKLVLGEPFALPVGRMTNQWTAFQGQLLERIAIVHELGAKYGAPVVKYQALFEAATSRAPAEYWIWDGIHPTYAGHQLMADEWVRTVREQWPVNHSGPDGKGSVSKVQQ